MKTVRVYELARELQISNKELIKKLNDYGVEVKSHMSSVDEETAELIYAELGESALEETSEETKEEIKVEEGTAIAELAKLLDIERNDILKFLINKGIMVNVNQRLNLDILELLSEKYGFEAIEERSLEERIISEEPDDPEKLVPRPPVVTIMGHVNHGKTSLLDAVRESNIMDSEAGGITQHIGAYRVRLDSGYVVFLDTPGHEAFTKMRSRGAQVTDVVVLVVAADDGVMPQTVEAIDHAKAADVPIVVAVNKIDKENANPNIIKQQLSEYQLIPEEWGGQTIFIDISAKNKIGVDELLENLLLEAELLELKANPDKPARGTIVESQIDRSRGPVATVLVQDGTLKIGDAFVAGIYDGKVRAMINDHGENVKEALPSTPVEVLGFSGVPEAGDMFFVIEDEKEAKTLSEKRQNEVLEKERAATGRKTVDIYQMIKEGEIKDLNLIIKGDVHGSIEALIGSLQGINSEEVNLNIIRSAVGEVTENDVILASASKAIIVGFNVRVSGPASRLADREGVDIKTYEVIYEAISDVKAAMEGLMEPELREVVAGRAQVLQLFEISRLGTVAGCMVNSGRIIRGSHMRLIRNNRTIHEGRIDSLKRFSQDVREISSGQECGILINDFSDFEVGDIIESYTYEEIPVTLG
ncbi:translation initiation factor IF-2 [Candidatus Poribacteria bacterium]|nr:translation initiation factor IF-2 [Candidatus Poribacteria bacterium]